MLGLRIGVEISVTSQDTQTLLNLTLWSIITAGQQHRSIRVVAYQHDEVECDDPDIGQKLTVERHGEQSKTSNGVCAEHWLHRAVGTSPLAKCVSANLAMPQMPSPERHPLWMLLKEVNAP